MTALLVIVLVAMTAPAGAHVAEVTTSVPLAEVRDVDSLRHSIGKAVDRARAETIRFEPSVVAVTGVHVLGERVLISLLFADADGEAMLEHLQGPHDGDRGPDRDDPGTEGSGSDELRI
jgi:hypothetical protein